MTTGGKIASFLVCTVLMLIAIGIVCVMGGILEDDSATDQRSTSSTSATSPIVTTPRTGPEVSGEVTITVTSVHSRRGRAPLEGAQVAVRDADRVVKQDMTAADGVLRLTGVETGEYELWVEAEGHRARRVPLTGSQIAVDVYKRARLQGLLRRSSNEPVIGARIRIAVQDGGESEYTEEGAPDPNFPAPVNLVSDTEGRFDVDVAPGYPLALTIEADGLATVKRDFGIVWPGQTRKTQITMRVPRSLVATLPFRWRPGVRLTVEAHGADGRSFKGHTSNSPQVTWASLEPGRYTLTAIHQTGTELSFASTAADVEPGRLVDAGELTMASTKLTLEPKIETEASTESWTVSVRLRTSDGAFSIPTTGDWEILPGAPSTIKGFPSGGAQIVATLKAPGRLRRMEPAPGFEALDLTVDVDSDTRLPLRYRPAYRMAQLFAAFATPPNRKANEPLRVLVEEWNNGQPGDVVWFARRGGTPEEPRHVLEFRPGSYRVTGFSSGHRTRPVVVALEDGRRSDVRLEEWIANPTVRGVVVDAAGRPRVNVAVEVVLNTSSRSDRQWTFEFTNTASDGSFELDYIPQLDNLIVQSKRLSDIASVPVPQDRTGQVEITLK